MVRFKLLVTCGLENNFKAAFLRQQIIIIINIYTKIYTVLQEFVTFLRNGQFVRIRTMILVYLVQFAFTPVTLALGVFIQIFMFLCNLKSYELATS